MFLPIEAVPGKSSFNEATSWPDGLTRRPPGPRNGNAKLLSWRLFVNGCFRFCCLRWGASETLRRPRAATETIHTSFGRLECRQWRN